MKPRIFLHIGRAYDIQKKIMLAQNAKKSGYDGVSIAEHVGGEDVFVGVGAISQRCENFPILTCIVNHHTRHPAVIGMAAASCAELCNGKFMLGLGSGAPDSLKMINLEDPRPLRKLAESVEIIRKLTEGNNVTYHGRFYSVSSLQLDQGKRHSVPILIAAIQEAAVRFAALHGDGVLLSTCSPEKYVADFVKTIRKLQAKPEFEIACIIPYVPISNRSEGLKIAKGIAQMYLMLPGIGEVLLEKAGFNPDIAKQVRKEPSANISDEVLDAMVVIGNRDKLWKRIDNMSSAGLSLVLISTPPQFINEILSVPKSSLG